MRGFRRGNLPRHTYLGTKYVKRPFPSNPRTVGYHTQRAALGVEITEGIRSSSLAFSQDRMRKKNRQNKTTIRAVVVSDGPGPWKAVTPYSRKVRLGVVANQAETEITVRNILNLQVLAQSSTGVNSLAYAVRLKKLRIWFTSPTVGTSISSTIEWNAGSTGFLMDGVSTSATTMSTTEPCLLVSRPPTQSLASWYQAGVSGSTNALFSLSAPAGAVIEVSYDWVPNFTEASFNTTTVTGATAGTLYCVGWNSNILALPPLNSVV